MYWLTEIQAVNPHTGEICLFAGPRIWADTLEDAEAFCENHGLGYCRVIGRFVEDVEFDEFIVWSN